MNRRSFLRSLGAAVAGIALGEAIPFNRVWSFPSKIMVPTAPVSTAPYLGNQYLTTEMVTKEVLRVLEKNLKFGDIVSFGDDFDRHFKVGTVITLKTPQRYLIREVA